MATKNYVLPATIAERFGITVDELLWSRKRGLAPGRHGFTVADGAGGRRLVFPKDLHPTIAENPDAAADKIERLGRSSSSETAAGGSDDPSTEGDS